MRHSITLLMKHGCWWISGWGCVRVVYHDVNCLFLMLGLMDGVLFDLRLLLTTAAIHKYTRGYNHDSRRDASAYVIVCIVVI
jgi:membrane protein required for beta-lactamase induction